MHGEWTLENQGKLRHTHTHTHWEWSKEETEARQCSKTGIYFIDPDDEEYKENLKNDEKTAKTHHLTENDTFTGLFELIYKP